MQYENSKFDSFVEVVAPRNVLYAKTMEEGPSMSDIKDLATLILSRKAMNWKNVMKT